MTPQLTPKQIKSLRGQAHALKPIVQMGQNGLTEALIGAVDAALIQHELIKVRLQEPDDKTGIAASIAEKTDAIICGLIGHTVILYKAHPNPDNRRVSP